METELLRDIACAILANIHGVGGWRTSADEYRKFKKIDNPLPGLSVGDTVYFYDEDTVSLEENRVLVVFEDVGYVFINRYFHGPSLASVDNETYARTREEAIGMWKSTITTDLTYAQEQADTIPGLKLLLLTFP